MTSVNFICHKTGNACGWGLRVPSRGPSRGLPPPALFKTACGFCSLLKTPQPLNPASVIESPTICLTRNNCVCGYLGMRLTSTCGGDQRTVFRSCLSSSTMRGPGIEAQLSGLVANAFTHRGSTSFPFQHSLPSKISQLYRLPKVLWSVSFLSHPLASLQLQKLNYRIEEMTPLSKCLLGKHEAKSSTPRIHIKSLL